MALLCSTLTQTGQQLTVNANSATIASQNYLQLSVPPASTCPKVKSIQFKCSSHRRPGFCKLKRFSPLFLGRSRCTVKRRYWNLQAVPSFQQCCCQLKLPRALRELWWTRWIGTKVRPGEHSDLGAERAVSCMEQHCKKCWNSCSVLTTRVQNWLKE